MRNFIDRNFSLIVGLILFSLPIGGTILAACSVPNTPEEKAEEVNLYTEQVKGELSSFSPRPGVECFVLRGRHSVEPRVMSCIGGVPVTTGQ